ncbi:DNA primase [Pseudoflavonifractor sp. MSJ-30]|uniref:DNA primase n=1 Tax=Pseudoflavonifractor sp. MSJ-30 TaxID=2841525 RepID=UPI001C104919|nr:DNA primase [Pseudoflavonifractor sp. MSJ-30]MBU5452921.1 DNA primase [Pseudoflavonifractor sp. MSJ-30]
MPFPPAFLDELAARNPIEEVVGQYVNLKRSGSNLFGLCPFHGEKTPSFSVAPDKGIYYCFGCHKGGGVINFEMEIEGLSYPDAVRALAQRVGMEVPDDEEYQSRYRKQERLWALAKEAARFFVTQLYAPTGAEGLRYAQSRGMSKGTLTRFGIGFAPDSWDSLCKAMRAKGYTDEELKDAGLVSVSQKNGNIFDRFRNRLMFPIIDVRGNVIGFGGRVMDNSTPKYLNSPETEIFNKRKNLFALNVAKKTKLGYLILVEGYMDAIALHQYGFDCAVASLGTSLTEEHAVLLSRYTEQVVLIYDGDEAGQNATRRAIPMLERAGLQVKVLQMRDAKDPDEFLKKFGADRFKLLLEESSNRVEYQLRAIQKKYDLNVDEDRVKFISEAAELVSSLGNAVQREIYGNRVAEAGKISSDAMKIVVNKAFKRRQYREKRKQERIDLAPAVAAQPKSRTIRYDNVRSAMAEEIVLAQCLSDAAMIAETEGLKPEDFSSPLLGRVFEQLQQQSRQGMVPSVAGLTDFTGEEMAHIAGILQRNPGPVSEQAMRDSIQVIRQMHEFKTADTKDTLMELQRKLQESKGIKA